MLISRKNLPPLLILLWTPLLSNQVLLCTPKNLMFAYNHVRGHGRAEIPAVSLPIHWGRSWVDPKVIASLSRFLLLRTVPPTGTNFDLTDQK